MEKTLGTYTTINKDDLSNLSEYELWYMIYKLENIIMICTYNKFRLDEYGFSKEDLEIAKYNLEYLIQYTKKYGVINEIGDRSQSYLMWYQKWQEYYDEISSKRIKPSIDITNNIDPIDKIYILKI